MRQASSVMLPRSVVRHLAKIRTSPLRYGDRYITYCGLDARKHIVENVDGDRLTFKYDLCKTCAKVRRLKDVDLVIPSRNKVATRRAEAMDAPIQEIRASVYRVQGSTDTYTVTVPHNTSLAGLCNCMAGKVHPEKQCKHQAAVKLMTRKVTA